MESFTESFMESFGGVRFSRIPTSCERWVADAAACLGTEKPGGNSAG